MIQPLTRRALLTAATTLVAVVLAQRALGGAGVPRHRYATRLGFQAYTLRDQLLNSPQNLLARLAHIGYREMELYNPAHVALLGPAAREAGIAIAGTHIPGLFATPEAWQAWRQGDDRSIPAGFDISSLIAAARVGDLSLLGYAHGAPREAYLSTDDARAYARLLDAVGARCHAAGLAFVYHNHWREFARTDGPSLFETLVEHSDPQHLHFEVDVCWAAQAGIDPAELIDRLGRRVLAIHLKDRTNTVAPSALAELRDEDLGRIVTEVGHGSLRIDEILAAASRAQVQHVFVEQDFTPGDPIDSLAASYRAVAALEA